MLFRKGIGNSKDSNGKRFPLFKIIDTRHETSGI